MLMLLAATLTLLWVHMLQSGGFTVSYIKRIITPVLTYCGLLLTKGSKFKLCFKPRRGAPKSSFVYIFTLRVGRRVFCKQSSGKWITNKPK